MCAMFPSLSTDELERAIVNISATLEIFQNATADALKKTFGMRNWFAFTISNSK